MDIEATVTGATDNAGSWRRPVKTASRSAVTNAQTTAMVVYNLRQWILSGHPDATPLFSDHRRAPEVTVMV
jgi:hypothetical protein